MIGDTDSARCIKGIIKGVLRENGIRNNFDLIDNTER